MRTPKRVAVTEKLSARKRDMSLYAGLNKTYEDVSDHFLIFLFKNWEILVLIEKYVQLDRNVFFSERYN